VFRPRTGDVASLAKVITESTSRRTPAGTIEPTVNVTVDPGTQSVVVTGSPGQVEQVSGLLEQLESGLSPTGNRQTRFIDVGGAAAQRLSPLVEQIYKASSPRLRGGAGSILSDPEAGRLIVTGPADHLTRMKKSSLNCGPARSGPRRGSSACCLWRI
jgi:type II secretory pathway component GspD/PulD (secretin)